MKCICQRVYNTGFSGIAKLDARLAHHYKIYGEDCYRRSYDHYAFAIPYSDTPRRPYCFVTKEQGVCKHTSCDHARYRPPKTVAEIRYYIENTACKAAVHYPDFLDFESDGGVPTNSGGVSFKTGGEETKFGTPDFLRRKKILGYISSDGVAHAEGLTALQRDYEPPNDEAVAEREAWEDAMFRIHRSMSYAWRSKEGNVLPNGAEVPKRKEPRNHTGTLRRESVEEFSQKVTELLTETRYELPSLDDRTHDELDPECNCEICKWDEATERLNKRIEKFWSDGYGEWSDEELQASYSQSEEKGR